jgi:lysozyme
MSPRGRELLAEWEGMRPTEYLDAGGLPTIGVGHLLIRSEISSGMLAIGDRLVPYSAGISREDALELLGQDLARFENLVSDAVKVPLAQHQFDALVSFAFNIGGTAFRTSMLLNDLNEGRPERVLTELRKWVNAGGHRISGLVARREAEISLWEGKV